MFEQERFAAWHRWLADLIHSMAPDVPVHIKTVTRAEHLGGTNLERLAAFSDINGHDGTMWGGDWMYPQFLDKLGSMRQAPIFNSEEHTLNGADWTRTALLVGAIHGRNASTIWLWDPQIEQAFRMHPEVTMSVGRTALDLNRLAPEFTALRNVPPRAAILTSEPSEFYNLGVSGAQGIAYKTLLFTGRPARFITEKQLAEGQLRHDMVLIVPASTHVYASTLAAITRFVDAGGRILAIGDSLLARDEHRQPHPAEQVQRALAPAVRVEDPRLTNLSIYGDSVVLQAIERALIPHFDRLLPTRVALADAVTHDPVEDVEWRAVSVNGRLLVTVANYSEQAKSVFLTVDGKNAERATELLSGATVGPTISLKGRTAYLLEIPETRTP